MASTATQRVPDEITDEQSLVIPRVAWADIAPEIALELNPGMHVSIFGLTGCGKTTLALELLELLVRERNASVVAFGTKARDQTLRDTHWPIIREWPPDYAERAGHRVVLWPPYSKPSIAKHTTGPVIRDALDDIMMEGGWRVFIDEIGYLTETLGLRTTLDEYFNGARSSEISLIAATQRPAWLPRSAVSQVDFVICFRLNDEDDRKRAAEVMGDRKRFAPVIGKLSKKKHEFLIVHNDHAVISSLERPTAKR